MSSLAIVSFALAAASMSQPAFALTPRHNHEEASNIAGDQEVILALKEKITQDPSGATEQWNDICAEAANATFTCEVNPFTNELALSSFDINGLGLEGDLTLDFLVELTDLTLFHANSNGFKGTVPEDLSGLQWLYEFDVSNNQLAGQFPQGILTATNLTYLDLRFNAFEGEVPAGVFGLDLEVLFLNDNLLTGSLAENLWSSPALYITLSNNGFIGCIPDTSNVDELKVVEILLGNNFLEGALPENWSAAASLTLFDAGNNLLSGAVPESLCGLSSIQTLNLTSNYFTEALGPNCAALKEQGILDISQNCISGEENQKTEEECA